MTAVGLAGRGDVLTIELEDALLSIDDDSRAAVAVRRSVIRSDAPIRSAWSG